MKHYISLVLLLFVAVLGYSQVETTEEELVPELEKTIQMVNPKLNMNMYHNRHDLEKLNKHVLTNIYLKRVQIINELLPLLALKANEGAYVEDVNIPLDKTRIKAAKKYSKAKNKYVDYLDETMLSQLTYADSNDLIWGILLLERIIADVFIYIEHDQVKIEEHGSSN